MTKKSSLELFLRKYPNQWHTYATDYKTKKQVSNLLKKYDKREYTLINKPTSLVIFQNIRPSILINKTTNQIYFEIKE